MDFKKYLKRINVEEPLQADIYSLRKLQTNHLLNIPFENLDIHFNREIKLDNDEIFNKIINHNRGGFCYELNSLFFNLLQHLGFEAKMISARVHKADDVYGPDFDHLSIIVKLNQVEYLTDVGFGDFASEPLKISINEIQNDPNGDYKIEKLENDWLRVSKLKSMLWKADYIFELQQRHFHEFSEMCQFHQSSPDSHFTKKRICSKLTPTGRTSIVGSKLRIKDQNGLQLIPIKTNKEFHDVLLKYFSIVLPPSKAKSVS